MKRLLWFVGVLTVVVWCAPILVLVVIAWRRLPFSERIYSGHRLKSFFEWVQTTEVAVELARDLDRNTEAGRIAKLKTYN